MRGDNEAGGDDLWDRFCDDLKRAGRVLRRPATPGDELTRAEGLRFLVRMVGIGFENSFDLGDPEHPRLIPMVDPLKVYEGVTSDARYFHSFIDGTASYRIVGTRGNAPLIEVSVYTGKAGIHEKSHQIGALTERDLVIAADGTLEVALGPDPQPGNWIPTSADTKYLMVRQYAHDWSGLEEAVLRIERVGGSARRPPVSLEAIEDGLRKTAEFAATAPGFWADISDYWAGAVVNRFVAQRQADEKTDIGAPTGHHFSCGWFRLAPDEALVATLSPQEVPYWSLGLANYWYETLGFGERGSEINDRTSIREPDGSVRAVIADTAPRGPNWLDTRGHREGTMIFRWSRSSDPVPPIQSAVVKRSDLPESEA